MATCGAGAIIAMTLVTEWQARGAAKISTEGNAQRQVLSDALRQNADVIRALGMTGRLAERWSAAHEHHIHHNTRLADVHANLGAAAKVLRFILQSAVLGVGAYLVVMGQASGGIMIASAIVMGRALAPVEIALSNWKQLVAAREGIGRLRAILNVTAAPPAPAVVLQRPHCSLTVEDLSVVVPGTQKTVVSQVSFELERGVDLRGSAPARRGNRRSPKRSWPSGRPRRVWCGSTARRSTDGILTILAATSAICPRMSRCSTAPSRKYRALRRGGDIGGNSGSRSGGRCARDDPAPARRL